VVFLSGVTFAFIEAPTLGWASPVVLTMTSLGVAGLVGFLVREHRAAAPMLPLSIFRERQFAAASAVTFIVYGALTGATFLLPVVLQVVSGYSPLASGLALLPLTVIMLALSARSGQLAARIGPRLQLSAGPFVVGAGLAMLTFSTSGPGYVTHVLPAVTVFGLGIAITVAPLTSTAMSSAPAQHAGIASAVNNDLSRFGGLLAVAILPALAGITGQAYLHPDALAAGFRIAVFISGGLCAAGGLLAAVTITNPPAASVALGHCLHCALEAPPLTTGPASYSGLLRRRRGRTSARIGGRSARRRSSRASARGRSLRARRRMVLSRRAGWSGARAGTSWRRPRSARSTEGGSVSRPTAACRPAVARSAR
jgi:hypothetical protein